MKKVIKIDGMGCQHCVKSVTNALENVSGVKILGKNWRSYCGNS